MIKSLHLFSSLLIATSISCSLPAAAEVFDIEENFDMEASFSQGGRLPDGWKQNSQANFQRRNSGSYYGVAAHSGSYALCMTGSGNDVGGATLFTAPMALARGAEATIEFQAYMPGGNPPTVRNLGLTVFAGTSPDVSQMTEIAKRSPAGKSSWDKVTGKFTPAEDGEYYFAIRLDNGPLPGSCGDVLLDTFFFTGTAAEKEPEGDPASTYPGMELLDPDSENQNLCQELPYFENFSDPSHYDGLSYLPKGWGSTGSTPWCTANIDNVPPMSGDYYMITPESSYSRDERAYTPFFDLQKGVTYTISFASHQERTSLESDVSLASIIKLKAGTQHDADFLPVTIAEIKEVNEGGRWSSQSFTFCPAVSGPYCFCFELEGPAYSGIVAIDDLKISSPVDLARPEPGFAARGIFNLMNSCLLSMDKDPIRIVNTSNYADEFEWDTNGAEYNQLPNGDIDIFLPSSGNYTIGLTASNARGTRSTEKTYNVQHVDESSQQMALMAYDPEESFIYSRSNQLTFPTDPEFDFVSGYNHYYRTVAEHFLMPPSAEFTISQISTWMAWLNYRTAMTDDDQRTKPFSVKIYGADENGQLDENKCFGGVETTMAAVFGGSGTNELNGRDIIFPEPVKCKGSIYIVFDFSEELDLNPIDKYYTRSYIAFNIVRHNHAQTTMFVKPHALPEGATAKVGEWAPVSDVDRSLKGLGYCFQLWASYTPGETQSVAIDSMGNTLFAARYFDGAVQISGTTEGEWLAIYDINGKCMATCQATASATSINLPELPQGLYIVSGRSGTAKFMK